MNDQTVANPQDAVARLVDAVVDIGPMAAMRAVIAICNGLEASYDPTSKHRAAYALVREAALRAGLIAWIFDLKDENLIVRRIATATLVLRGYSAERADGGTTVRTRDRWRAVLEILEDGAKPYFSPEHLDHRPDVVALLADLLAATAGAPTPPSDGLVIAALNVVRLPSEERGTHLLALVTALGLPSSDAESLERSLRKSAE